MVGNYHILIVHFPIAFFTIYTFLELFKSKSKHSYWFHIRSFILYIGIIGGIFAIISGGAIEAEHILEFGKLFEMHELYATLSFWIYLILGLGYLMAQFRKTLNKIKLVRKYKKEFDELEYLIHESYFSYVLVILGFIFLSIAGALGGAMVSGPDVDIFTSIIYKLLICNVYYM